MRDHGAMLTFACKDRSPKRVATATFTINAVGCGVATSAWSTPTSYRTYGHSLYEVLSGEASISIDGRWFRLRPGNLYAIPGHRQVQRRTSGFEHRYVSFKLGAFSEDLHLGCLDRILSFSTSSAVPWQTALQRACQLGIDGLTAQPVAATALEGLLLQVVAAMREAGGGSPAPAPTDGPLAAALVFLDRHYARMPSLIETAHAAGRSPAHLHSLFTATIGRSPSAYALHRRMGDAYQLLTATATAVAQVAERCGYTDPQHFSRVVRRHFGCSPLQVRAMRNDSGFAQPVPVNRSGGVAS